MEDRSWTASSEDALAIQKPAVRGSPGPRRLRMTEDAAQGQVLGDPPPLLGSGFRPPLITLCLAAPLSAAPRPPAPCLPSSVPSRPLEPFLPPLANQLATRCPSPFARPPFTHRLSPTARATSRRATFARRLLGRPTWVPVSGERARRAVGHGSTSESSSGSRPRAPLLPVSLSKRKRSSTAISPEELTAA